MTIKRGVDWGEEVEHPTEPVELTSDAAVAASIASGESRPLLVRGGDLHRSLGSPVGPATRRLAIDVIRVTADGAAAIAVAHVVVRRRGPLGWWRGPIIAVMNVDHVGPWDVAPRAHPNDGRLDIVEVSAVMSVRHRWQARRRLATGTHLPHPAITNRPTVEASFEFAEALSVWVDGVNQGTVRALHVRVEPDAAVIHA